MADEVVATGGENKYKPHPEGQYVAQCVDVVDLGVRVEAYPGQPHRLVKKVALIFHTGQLRDDGQPFDLGAEYTVSMSEKAALRATLESWRGKSYDDETAKAGVPLHMLVGHHALISVENRKSAQGRLYAKIKSISPVPEALPKPDLSGGYARADYWAERKQSYATEVAAFVQANAVVSHEEDNVPDLPF